MDIREILVRRVDQQKQATGIVVGLIEPGGRRLVTYGHLAKGDRRAVDGNTIFEIGSVSKVFTSLLLADMVHRKEVALDDAAATYLPAHVKMPERNGIVITLRDLSTHRSGLPPMPGNLLATMAQRKDPDGPYVSYGADDLYEFLSSYSLPRDPGSEFEYSNLGAGLLGHLLAYRAGTDYESLVRNRITQPLGMPDTGITLSSSVKQRRPGDRRAQRRHCRLPVLRRIRSKNAYRRCCLVQRVDRHRCRRHRKSSPEPEGAARQPRAPMAHTEIQIEPALLDNYIGRYRVTPHLVQEITRDEDRLFAQGFAQLPQNRPGDLTGLPKFELFGEGEHTFFARVSEQQITFDTGPDGRATGLIVRKAGRDMRGLRLPDSR